VVLDSDVQAGTDRYVREMRAKFLSARLALNPLSVRLLDFYLPHRNGDAGAEVLGAPASAPPERPAGAGGPAGEGLPDGPELRALRQWARREGEAVVVLSGPGGYPAVSRTRAAPGVDGSIELERAPGSGPAALTFHSEGMGGVRLDAVMARGWVLSSGGSPRFVPRRVVGFLGRPAGARPKFLSVFPLSQLPRAAELRETLGRELARRGEALPRLRVPR